MAEAEKAERRVFVVSGGNKGIGYEIVKGLCVVPDSTVVLTSRDSKRALEAVETLVCDNVVAHDLDISVPASCDRFCSYIAESFGKIDVLINNAGFAYHGSAFGVKEAEKTLGVNLRGTIDFTTKILPMLAENGKIINVCSMAGRLGQVSKSLQERIASTSATKEDILLLADEFIESIALGTLADQGWPRSMYGVSKLLEIAYTFLLERQLKDGPRRIQVSAVCPGWCATDMSSWKGPRSAAKGAETPIWLALQPRDGKSGGFWSDKKPKKW